MPALSHLEGGVLDLAREALTMTTPRPRAPGLPPAGCSPTPTGERTTLDGSKLWQVALLELCVQVNGI